MLDIHMWLVGATHYAREFMIFIEPSNEGLLNLGKFWNHSSHYCLAEIT